MSGYRYFDAEDGARLAYRDEGDGLPLLALAGLTRAGRDFDYLAPHLPAGIRLIRLDSRGRGASQWTGAASYTVAQEARDALALLDHLGLDRVALLGTSRGGLIGLLLAATARDRLLGLCLNDVGPVLEREGLLRIAAYVGVPPKLGTHAAMARRLAEVSAGFEGVSPERWLEEAERHFTALPDGLGLTYDPALAASFAAIGEGPLPDAWPLFEACAGLPLALLRGENSDLLSRDTAREMQRRRPDLVHAEVPGRGHIPFLDEAPALAVISAWLERVKQEAAVAEMPMA